MTDAMLHTITGRSRAVEVQNAALDQFDLDGGQAVSSQPIADSILRGHVMDDHVPADTLHKVANWPHAQRPTQESLNGSFQYGCLY